MAETPAPGKTGMKISYSMKNQPVEKEILALEQKALGHYEAGRYAEALIETRKILDRDPAQIEAVNFAGLLHAEMGDLETAASLLRQVVQKNAKHFDAYNNLGGIMARMGQLDQAVDAFQTALRINPNEPAARDSLAHVREVRDNLDARIKQARGAIEEDPIAVGPRMMLGMLLLERGQAEESLRAVMTAVRMDPENIDAHNLLMRILSELMPARFDRDLDGALEWAFDSPFSYLEPLALLVPQHLILKHDLAGFIGESPALIDDGLIGGLARDPLFLKYLRQMRNADPGMELFLTRLRARLLDHHADTPEGLPEDLAGALAEQAFLGEFVWQATEEELAAAAALRDRAAAALAGPGEDTAALLLHGLYHELSALAPEMAEVPDGFSEPVRRVVEIAVAAPAQEAALRPGIERLEGDGDAGGAESRAAQAGHPYPRWAGLPKRPPVDLAAEMPRRFADMAPADYLAGEKTVLIAGCGTGWHPLNVAMLYRDSQVLAVDVSPDALAYAKRMAARHGIGNIDFLEADILSLDRLGRQFDIVECIGVLHHMADPAAGWRALSDVLRPGGLLKMGLMSEKARQFVHAARERVLNERAEATAEGIRAFRAGILAEGLGAGWDVLLQEPDFYATGPCRDMLFREREQRYTIPMIQDAVRENGLKFLGFELSNPTWAQLYEANYPNDRAMRILGNWAALEANMPAVILRYEFWCQKQV